MRKFLLVLVVLSIVSMVVVPLAGAMTPEPHHWGFLFNSYHWVKLLH